MEIVLSVAFVIATTSFFSKVFKLQGYWSFVAAGVLVIVVMEYPVFLAFFPDWKVWLDPIAKGLALLFSAAGTYDFSAKMADKSSGQ